MRRALVRLLVASAAVLILNSCTSPPQAATIRQVTSREPITVKPQRFSPTLPPDAIVIEAIVVDTRPGDALLVELSDEADTAAGTANRDSIWVRGFPLEPRRGSKVLVALVGDVTQDDKLGNVYTTSGPIDPKGVKSGLTEEGALGVLLLVALGLALLVPVAPLIFQRLGASRRCQECRARLEAGWRTCPDCGHAQELNQGSAPAPPASTGPAPPPVAVQRATSVTPSGQLPAASAQPPPGPTDRPTRIVQGD